MYIFLCSLGESFLQDIFVYLPSGSVNYLRCVKIVTHFKTLKLCYLSFGRVIFPKYFMYLPLETSFLKDTCILVYLPLGIAILSNIYLFICPFEELFSKLCLSTHRKHNFSKMYLCVYELSFLQDNMFICLFKASYLNKTYVYLPCVSTMCSSTPL